MLTEFENVIVDKHTNSTKQSVFGSTSTWCNSSQPELTAMNPNQLLPTEKCKHSHPKGSKNGSNAGTVGRPVGRPRKDGNLWASKPDKPGKLRSLTHWCISCVITNDIVAPSQSTSAEVGGTNCDIGQPLAGKSSSYNVPTPSVVLICSTFSGTMCSQAKPEHKPHTIWMPVMHRLGSALRCANQQECHSW